MRQHDPLRTLRQMNGFVHELTLLSHGHTRGEFEKNRAFQLQVLHLFALLGEGAARISAWGRIEIPQIPWVAMRDLRNRIIHGYDTLNYEKIWQVVRGDLTGLSVEITQAILRLEQL